MPAIMQPDPRFEAVLNLIRSGEFGWEGYFAQLIDSLNGSSDYYLLANDFPSYLEAQVRPRLSRKNQLVRAWITPFPQHWDKPLSVLRDDYESRFVNRQLQA